VQQVADGQIQKRPAWSPCVTQRAKVLFNRHVFKPCDNKKKCTPRHQCQIVIQPTFKRHTDPCPLTPDHCLPVYTF
jgi:hypothetical protein